MITSTNNVVRPRPRISERTAPPARHAATPPIRSSGAEVDGDGVVFDPEQADLRVGERIDRRHPPAPFGPQLQNERRREQWMEGELMYPTGQERDSQRPSVRCGAAAQEKPKPDEIE